MSWATLLAVARRHWPLAIATLSAAFFAGLLLVTRAERDAARQALAIEQAERKSDHDRADHRRAEQERGFAERQARSTSTFATQLAAREPIIVRSTNTVREYAQTDAGRAGCLDADGVRRFAEDRAALFDDPRAAASRADPVPAR
ncbi:hypothetical protein GCM10022253_17290 [Sphingomonas endophytica]|uniref:Uncharacterized protein n=1 Tax=Sphingomonas endophytica TaxID=869719 RepID=A0ABR6N7C4_9SPHN|nr:hypothetical protein [Sphingomonas endophytica]MBB5726705.1 hypothetical protein [Sphingomonas endophytica]